MQEIVKEEVQLGTILERSVDEMATNILSYIAVKVDGILAGFCALHIHSTELAEIRSLIITKEFRNKKLGKTLVEKSIKEAEKLSLKEILSLTYKKEFFQDLGFIEISKEILPKHKIWVDCIKCKHFPTCDEIAMIYKIG